MIKTVIFVLAVLVTVVFLAEIRKEYSLIVVCAAGAFIIISVAISLKEPIDFLLSYAEKFSVEASLIKYIFKVFGICYAVKFSSELCKDFGQTSLCSKVEFAGKAAVFIMTLPLVEKVFMLAEKLL